MPPVAPTGQTKAGPRPGTVRGADRRSFKADAEEEAVSPDLNGRIGFSETPTTTPSHGEVFETPFVTPVKILRLNFARLTPGIYWDGTAEHSS
jgi:hypothetical protein